MTITNKIKTGQFVTEDEYKSLLDAINSGGTIEFKPGGITITRSAQSVTQELLQKIAVIHGLPELKSGYVRTGLYGLSDEREIIAPADADEWKKKT